MKRVFVCSPLRGDRGKYSRYLEAALTDSWRRGEAPFAPHAMYPHYLNDECRTQRELGIYSGLAWLECAELVAVYIDLGISDGMARERNDALAHMIDIEYRSLPEWAGP